MSIASKATCILYQRSHILGLSHLVEHGTLDITCDTYEALVCGNLNNIVVLQGDTTCQTSVEDIFVEVNHSDQTSVTEDLDITQCTQIAGTACPVKRIEDVGKGGQVIGTRSTNLAHYVNLDGTHVTHLDLQVAALETGANGRTQFRLCCGNRKTTEVDGTIACNGDGTLRGDGMHQRLLRSAIDIHNHLVARTQDIRVWNGHIGIGLETGIGLTEDVATENSLALCIRGSTLCSLHILLCIVNIFRGIVLDGTGCTNTSCGELLRGCAIGISLHTGCCHADSPIGCS